MSQHTLPDLSAAAIAPMLSPEHRSFLASLQDRTAVFRGFTMKDDGDGDDGNDDDGEDEDFLELDDDDKVKVGDKVMTVAELQRIAAREKRQGKKAGQRSVLARLGYDSVEELEEALQGLGSGDDDAEKDKGKKTDDEDARPRQKRDQGAEDRLRSKERKLDLRGALRDAGVSRDDLDDGYALLNNLVDRDYDEDDLADAVEQLKATRAGKALFESGEDDTEPKTKRKAGYTPQGRPKGKPKPPGKPFGAGGVERARRRGWIKDDA